MSILIKGAKPPGGCAFCYFNVDSKCALIPGCNYDETNGWQRREDCPLIELPDHGDLIDKNRMIDVLHHGNKCVSEIQKDAKDEASISYCQGVMIGYTNSIVALDFAPVVIPAERSEE